jgi:hypothetical protein
VRFSIFVLLSHPHIAVAARFPRNDHQPADFVAETPEGCFGILPGGGPISSANERDGYSFAEKWGGRVPPRWLARETELFVLFAGKNTSRPSTANFPFELLEL